MKDFTTRTIAMLAAVTMTISASSDSMRVEAVVPAADGTFAPAILPSAMEARRLFISGHSLTDHPYPTQLAAIAESLGRPIQWNVQNQFGSSLRARTRGEPADDGTPAQWTGYRHGKDRYGRNVDVLDELAHPGTTDGKPYDTLLVTEQHTLLGNIVWNGTGRYLRDFHDRMIRINPGAQSFLFASWLGINDLNNPDRWISYERSASLVWACLAEEINRSLAQTGRQDRIQVLPAALALATLVKRATSEAFVPGITQADTSATMRHLFSDDVHLTKTGSYYIALTSYAFLYRRPPSPAWAPPGMPPTTAEALQKHAWNFTVRYIQNYRPLSPAQCRRYVSETFVPDYLDYIRAMQIRDGHVLRAWLSWARYRFEWPRLFRRRDGANPLIASYGDPAALNDPPER